MRKDILDLAISLDGFIEGPNNEIEWRRKNKKCLNFLRHFYLIFYMLFSYLIIQRFRILC